MTRDLSQLAEMTLDLGRTCLNTRHDAVYLGQAVED